MQLKRLAPAAAVICLIALCAILAGVAINSLGLTLAGVCIAALAGILAMAFFLQEP